jgi:YD repeat-containing protein
MKYPHDLASGNNVYSAMLAKNIISPVVQSQRLYNGIQCDLHNLNFLDWSGTGNLLLPTSVDEQVRSNPIETRYLFNQYDKYGNILQQQKTGDMFQSYIWDYNSVYPVAKCSNAAVGSIAATSFEADGSGGWTTGGTSPLTGGVTGNQYYSLSSDISFGGLSTSASYVVSYWSNNGAYSVPGTAAGYPVTGKKVTIGGVSWTYYEHLITGQSGAQLNGSGGIDELRLYPANALMTTYTYAPLVGMTSQCDEGNRITYYEYDELGRLRDVRDQDGNVVKTYDYHYHATN